MAKILFVRLCTFQNTSAMNLAQNDYGIIGLEFVLSVGWYGARTICITSNISSLLGHQ